VLEHEREMNELRANRPDLSAMSDRELIDYATRIADEHFEKLFTEHIFISFLATVPIGVITAVCEAVGKPDATLKLLAGLGRRRVGGTIDGDVETRPHGGEVGCVDGAVR
jgi:hypothetical protein